MQVIHALECYDNNSKSAYDPKSNVLIFCDGIYIKRLYLDTLIVENVIRIGHVVLNNIQCNYTTIIVSYHAGWVYHVAVYQFDDFDNDIYTKDVILSGQNLLSNDNRLVDTSLSVVGGTSLVNCNSINIKYIDKSKLNMENVICGLSTNRLLYHINNRLIIVNIDAPEIILNSRQIAADKFYGDLKDKVYVDFSGNIIVDNSTYITVYNSNLVKIGKFLQHTAGFIFNVAGKTIIYCNIDNQLFLDPLPYSIWSPGTHKFYSCFHEVIITMLTLSTIVDCCRIIPLELWSLIFSDL